MQDGLIFSAFLVGSAKAVINAVDLVIGGVNMVGRQWILSDSTLIKPRLHSVPGTSSNVEQWAIIQ
jgi:hypothetical protein